MNYSMCVKVPFLTILVIKCIDFADDECFSLLIAQLINEENISNPRYYFYIAVLYIIMNFLIFILVSSMHSLLHMRNGRLVNVN